MSTKTVGLFVVAALVSAAVCGCEPGEKPMLDIGQKSQESKGKDKLVSDIYSIIKFYPQDMWRRKDNTDGNPDGFNVAIYLVSGETKKGAFGDGTIKVDMDVVEKGPDGRRQFTPVQTWELSPEDAKPFRTTRQSIMGWAYQLYLFWDPDVDVLNREVRISISYIRSDGKEILSKPAHRRVPVYDTDAYRGSQGAAAS